MYTFKRDRTKLRNTNNKKPVIEIKTKKKIWHLQNTHRNRSKHIYFKYTYNNSITIFTLFTIQIGTYYPNDFHKMYFQYYRYLLKYLIFKCNLVPQISIFIYIFFFNILNTIEFQINNCRKYDLCLTSIHRDRNCWQLAKYWRL